MQELELKYGVNPNQTPARIYVEEGGLPLRVLNGRPGYINFLDALNAWQLVAEMQAATGLVAAASFKHVSPAGAAVGLPLSAVDRAAFGVAEDAAVSPLAAAYARARGADRMSSYGDWAALSAECDAATAKLLQPEVSDGVIAPAFTAEALDILKGKRKGNYAVVQIDAGYTPPALERRTVFGVTFEQGRNDLHINEAMLQNIPTIKKELTEGQKRDLVLSLIILKYTQSNSVCCVENGQAIGIGAGQQSRVHCTRLACGKADTWHLRRHEKVLALPFAPDAPRAARDNAIDAYLSDDFEAQCKAGLFPGVFTAEPAPLSAAEKRAFLSCISGVALGSDAFFPFSDNIERAAQSGVSAIAQPGGSVRDTDVIAAADRHGITMAFTGARLFHH